jgi:hypothetical protein
MISMRRGIPRICDSEILPGAPGTGGSLHKAQPPAAFPGSEVMLSRCVYNLKYFYHHEPALPLLTFPGFSIHGVGLFVIALFYEIDLTAVLRAPLDII